MNQKLVQYVDKGEAVEHYFVDGVSGIIYFVKRHNGKLIRFSTKTTSIVKAKRYANPQFDKRTGKRKGGSVSSLIKDELVAWQILKEGEGLKPDTLKNVRNAIKQIEPFWGEMFPHQIHRDNLALWYKWFRKTYPDQQMENAVKYMRNFCRYLAEKVVDDQPLLPAVPTIKDPNANVIQMEREEKKERVFTLDEFTKLYSASDDQEKILMLFMYTMALRVSQALELKWEQLDLDNETYRFRKSDNKAGLAGLQDIHSALVPLLKARKRAIGGKFVFPQKFKDQPMKEQQIDWLGLEDRAGLTWHWTSHTCRHTCLTNLFNDERNPQAAIIKLYRVSLAVALKTYIKIKPETRLKMKNAIEFSL